MTETRAGNSEASKDRQGLSKEEFTGLLREVVYPIYLSAQTCGFSSWEYDS